MVMFIVIFVVCLLVGSLLLLGGLLILALYCVGKFATVKNSNKRNKHRVTQRRVDKYNANTKHGRI